VRIDPQAGRWPEHAAEDRLSLGAGCAALVLLRTPEALLDGSRAALTRAATRLASPELDPVDAGEGPLGGLAADGGRLEAEVTVALARSVAGPVPSLGRPAPPPADLLVGALALLAELALAQGAEERLAAALAIEGLLGWWAAADPTFQPPQQAVAYALRHAGARLEEAGRPIPPGLRAAIAAHAVIRPMAGGAERCGPGGPGGPPPSPP
jgi:hypothetical protein